MLIDSIVILLFAAGLIFFTTTTIGILRFPDFFARIHAAGKGDTLSTILLLAGIVLYYWKNLNLETLLAGIKMLLIIPFIFIASPTATHAILDAGHEAGLAFWKKQKKTPPAGDSNSEAPR